MRFVWIFFWGALLIFCVVRLLALTTWVPQKALTLSETISLLRPKGLVHWFMIGQQAFIFFRTRHRFYNFFEVILKKTQGEWSRRGRSDSKKISFRRKKNPTQIRFWGVKTKQSWRSRLILSTRKLSSGEKWEWVREWALTFRSGKRNGNERERERERSTKQRV